jgi:hypothetical protein
MLSWLRRRRESIERIYAEADALIQQPGRSGIFRRAAART